MLIFDAHLDLSLNALDWKRDLRLPADQIRAAEAGMRDLPGRGAGTVALPDMRRGDISLCVATLIAPTHRPENPVPGWSSPEQAWAQIIGQAAWYDAMVEAGEMRRIEDLDALEAHLAAVAQTGADTQPVGYVLSLEGADPILGIGHLERLCANHGLKALGPAHYGAGRFANGTDSTGHLGDQGKTLVREMDRLGLILDVSHLCDDSFWDALEIFGGPVWASHTNARALVPHNRQFSDEQYRALIARGAAIGVVGDAWMLKPGWIKGTSTPEGEGVTLAAMADHIDHICQLAGNADHAGIGSDLDGGFGKEASPADLDTIADLQAIFAILRQRGYHDDDLAKIAHGNFIRVLRDAWSD